MRHDAHEAEQVWIGTPADNQVSRRVIEQIAFRYIGSLMKKRRLFNAERYAVTSDSRVSVMQCIAG